MAFNQGRIPRGELPVVIEAVRQHATPSLQASLQKLLKQTILAAPTGEEARKLKEHVAERGDAQRGKAIFLDSKKGGCAACHQIEGVGTALGPDLSRVWQTLSFEERGQGAARAFQGNQGGLFDLQDRHHRRAAVVTGLLVAQSADAITLRDARGQEVKISAREIEQKGNDPTSIMPTGVVGNLSFKELADLLAFLGDRQAQESLRRK